MTLYKRSWLFTAWTLLIFLSFPFWFSIFTAWFSEAGFLVAATFWLSHGLAMLFLFRCPECGLSPYLGNKGFFTWSQPWPRRICGHCGKDHSVARQV
jgi:hypothetical protein